MNRLLIVEDNHIKLEGLRNFINSTFNDFEIFECTSYNSASKEIALNYKQYNLILLDVSMQIYDISSDESGGDSEPLAGKNILNQMFLRDIPTKVIVVTMYENFVDGTKIKELDKEFKEKYSENYFGYIFFSHNSIEWQKDLKDLITKTLND